MPSALMNTKWKLKASQVCFYYGKQRILDNISLVFPKNALTAITGPSGHGKTTLLSCFNRLWEEHSDARFQGKIEMNIDGQAVDIHKKAFPAEQLRRKVSMVFQKPNPFPTTIFRNLALPLRFAGIKDRSIVGAKVKKALEMAFLWDEVKNRLGADARTLSGGQQQRLCIARSLVLNPEVLLLDEPTASLDPRACRETEELLMGLKSQCTLLMVSHYMDQVHRIADYVVEIENGVISKKSSVPSKMIT